MRHRILPCQTCERNHFDRRSVPRAEVFADGLAGEEVARTVSGDHGRVTFDMRAILVENFSDRPAENMKILLTTTRLDGKEARYEWILFDALVGHFLGREPAKTGDSDLPD